MGDQRQQQMVGMQSGMGQPSNVLPQPGMAMSHPTSNMQPQQSNTMMQSSGGISGPSQMYMPTSLSSGPQQQQEQQPPARSYSSGPGSAEPSVQMRSSNVQQLYGTNVPPYIQSDTQQSHYQSVQQPQTQPIMSHTSAPPLRYVLFVFLRILKFC